MRKDLYFLCSPLHQRVTLNSDFGFPEAITALSQTCHRQSIRLYTIHVLRRGIQMNYLHLSSHLLPRLTVVYAPQGVPKFYHIA